MSKTISAVILTKNESKNIRRCIDSILWCEEIVIIDDYSEDETVERIKNYESRIKKKLKFFRRHLNGDFAAQRNFGLEKASEEWVLFIDSDEVVSDKLAEEIKKNISILNNKCGFCIKRRDYFLGKWLNYGETGNIRLPRLAKRNTGEWQGRVHETWNIDGEIGELENPILHYPHQTITLFLKKINWYTDIVAQYWLEQGRRVETWEILFYPSFKFLQNYIFRLGFLDGIAGLIMGFMMSFHSFLVRGKLWLTTHKNG